MVDIIVEETGMFWTPDKMKTIWVLAEQKICLDKLKVIPRESYHCVIARLIESYEKSEKKAKKGR